MTEEIQNIEVLLIMPRGNSDNCHSIIQDSIPLSIQKL